MGKMFDSQTREDFKKVQKFIIQLKGQLLNDTLTEEEKKALIFLFRN